MRKTFAPLFLFVGLLAGGLYLQQRAGERRQELEESIGGTRIGVSLETAASFARQLETIEDDAPAELLRAPLPDASEPSIARSR